MTPRLVALGRRLGSVLDTSRLDVAGVWAIVKAVVFAPFAALGWTAIATPSRHHVRRAFRVAEDLPDLADGRIGAASGVRALTLELDMPERLFVSSDLHRTPPGRRDWVNRSGNGRLYDAVLNHYAEDAWYLVENGDVEDFWMVGGSSFGVVYDAVRLVGTALGPVGRPIRRWAYREQLRRTVANHRYIYDTLDRRFHLVGRYARIIGNHDDVYYDPDMRSVLRQYFPGLPIGDILSLRCDGALVGYITHGQLPDPWNGGSGAWRGRMVTWLASLVGDLPFGSPTELGMASEFDALRPLRGTSPNVLIDLNLWMGVNGDRQTLDEAHLHAVFSERFGADDGPWLICGHTHVPLSNPVDRVTGDHFSRYLNCGSGVAPGVVTGVEWERGRDPQVVAFSFDQPEPGVGRQVGTFGGRVLYRTVLRSDGQMLRPADARCDEPA